MHLTPGVVQNLAKSGGHELVEDIHVVHNTET